jgi:hypothetical protein
MRGILVGLVLLPAVALAVLSIRPGGLRRQLRFAARRLRIALVLGGIYVLASMVARFALGDTTTLEWVLGALALGLGITFVVLAQDPQPARR